MDRLNFKANLVFVIAGIIILECAIRNITNWVLSILIGSRGAYLYDSKITAIGVIHHELSHILFALMFGAEVTQFHLFNIIPTNDNELGSVAFRTNGSLAWQWVQRLMIGLAPAFMGTVTATLSAYCIVNEWNASQWCVLQKIWIYPLAFVAGSVAYHSGPSMQDIKIAAVPIILVLIASLFLEPFKYMRQAYAISVVIAAVMAAVSIPAMAVSLTIRLYRTIRKTQ